MAERDYSGVIPKYRHCTPIDRRNPWACQHNSVAIEPDAVTFSTWAVYVQRTFQ